MHLRVSHKTVCYFLAMCEKKLILSFAGSHTLLVLATFLKGETQFPEFNTVVMLDDIQVVYYDWINKTALPRNPHLTEPIDDEDQNDFEKSVENFYSYMRQRILFLGKYFNKTTGKSTAQHLSHP